MFSHASSRIRLIFSDKLAQLPKGTSLLKSSSMSVRLSRNTSAQIRNLILAVPKRKRPIYLVRLFLHDSQYARIPQFAVWISYSMSTSISRHLAMCIDSTIVYYEALLQAGREAQHSFQIMKRFPSMWGTMRQPFLRLSNAHKANSASYIYQLFRRNLNSALWQECLRGSKYL